MRLQPKCPPLPDAYPEQNRVAATRRPPTHLGPPVSRFFGVAYLPSRETQCTRQGDGRLVGGWESPHRPSFDLISLIRTPIQTEFYLATGLRLAR